MANREVKHHTPRIAKHQGFYLSDGRDAG
jgi:hypothetical protein